MKRLRPFDLTDPHRKSSVPPDIRPVRLTPSKPRVTILSKQSELKTSSVLPKGVALHKLTYRLTLLLSAFTKPHVATFALLACWMLIGTSSAWAQSVVHTENRADQVLRGNFRVDPSTLGMSFSIPLGAYPGRAGAHVPVTLNYNSKLWRIDFDSIKPWLNQNRSWTSATYGETSTSGWTSSLEIPFIEYTGRTQFYDASGNSICGLCPEETASPYYVKRIHVHLSDSSAKELRTDDGAILFDSQNLNGDFTGTFKAVDGSGIYFDSTDNTLYLPDGSRYVFSSTEVGIHGKMGRPATAFIDRNGNTISFNSQNRSWSDTLGRPFTDPIPNQPPAPGEQIYDLPGIGGNTWIRYKLRWANLENVLRVAQPLAYTGDRKCNPTITQLTSALFQTFDTVTFVCAKLSADGNPEYFNPVVLSEVELPTGQKYQFKYNNRGEIEQVFLPTGGYERYQYEEIQALSLPNQPYKQTNRGVTSRWISADGTNEIQWQYNLVSTSPYIVRTTAPDTSYTERVIVPGCSTITECMWGIEPVTAGMVKEERTKTSNHQMLQRNLSEWLVPGRPTKEVSITLDTGGNALATKTTYQYDTDLNLISTSKYDFLSIDQTTAQTATIDAIASLEGWTAVRTEEATFLENDPLIDATKKAAYRARNLISLPTSTRIRNGGPTGPIVAKSEFEYDETTDPVPPYGAVIGWNDPGTNFRGLVTTTRNWVNTTGEGIWLETHARYDQCGSPRKLWDALGYLSEMEYSSANHRAYMTQSTSPDPDGSGAVTPLVTSAIFDLTSGVPLSTTDANVQTTTFEYLDTDALANLNPFQRLTKVIQPDGGTTAYGYSDTPGSVYVLTKTALDASRYLQSYQYADGLGRPWRSVRSEGATSIYVDTQYDVNGRTWKVSNPYRNGEPDWTTTLYDALGRIVSITTPDGAQLSTAYGGSTTGTLGSTVTITDQSGKKRKSVTDALGRLREVYEDHLGLNYLTSYGYDTLNDLTTVTQDTQTRSFVYDSLRRLISATNPESGTISYSYDENGNLLTKTDARSIVSTYSYDALNRNTGITYSNDPAGTLPVTRTYDLATHGKGRLYKSETTGSGGSLTTIDAYDVMGRPTTLRQQFYQGGDWTQSYAVQRTYNLAGGITSQNYPSGHTVNYNYDAAGRLGDNGSNLAFTGNLGDGMLRTYAQGNLYSPFGGLKHEQFGTDTPIFNRSIYNSRGQLAEIRVSTSATYPALTDWNRGAILNQYSDQCDGPGCNGTDNNGNLKRQEVFIPHDDQINVYTNWLEQYDYDSLNRLQRVKEKNTLGTVLWQQEYVYDRWGNRLIHQTNTWGPSSGPLIPKPNFEVDTVNRLYAPGDLALPDAQRLMRYDAAGNLKQDTYSGA
ncbi:MAG TPA: hypothetical protein VJS64_10615, partial [Pyrinomonadaceae bacterium]|nr:hypothetical protein [Pyrinomonadaceae bacterium]